MLSEWPEALPADWAERVNTPLTARERDRMKIAIARSRPFGDDGWVSRTASRLNLEHTMRREGRPAKAKAEKVGDGAK